MNNISIVGRITKDPELITVKGGLKMCRFAVAVPSEFKNADGERIADYFLCVAWRDNAQNIAKYIKKGYPIGVVGSMNSRVYQDENEKNATVWELNVKNFYFVGTMLDESKYKKKPAESKKNDDLDF